MLHKVTKYTFGSHSKFAVIGGGTGGLNLVAHLRKTKDVLDSDIRVFEPSKVHYYQPSFTLVAAGL